MKKGNRAGTGQYVSEDGLDGYFLTVEEARMCGTIWA